MSNLFKYDFIEMGEVVIRSLFSLITLFFITKMLGKKQVSQLSLFDYVIGISIGNFGAEISINTEIQYINGIVAVLVFGIVAYIISYITMKSLIFRRFFMGSPTILIDNGKIIYNNLRKVKFDINDLLEECRSNNYFDLSYIAYAILEPNGSLSILPKSEYFQVTRKDMNLSKEKIGLIANVIIDGQIMEENLKTIGKTKKWLLNSLKIRGYKDINKILLATVDINEKIVIYDKVNSSSTHNILE